MSRLTSFILGSVLGLACTGVIAYAFLTHQVGMRSKSETLITPLTSEVANTNLSIGARISLEDELRGVGDVAIASGNLTDYSIFYRELVSGPGIAIRETEGFFPASLLKLPVAMWYYHHAEENPNILFEEIEFVGPKGKGMEYFPPTRSVEEGRVYTVEALIELMLTESDNDATAVLVEYAGGRDVINKVYHDLGIRDVDDYETYTIDTHTYIAFFRVLFNGEYLTREASQALLEVLTRTSFSAGLTAHLPESIAVAHKFGERTIDAARGINQLHDCGIVYAPENPYLICVMTQGGDYEEMTAFIADVSARIYRTVSASTL